ncbi:MAG: methyl-accepting chemotaxis protein [Deltaproteobacteria bacterium]|nr:methyl-accepting chemotaxis protein [Deltaproteobacteria bacterium]
MLTFIVVSSIVIYDLRSVRYDTHELKDHVIPNSDLAAEAKYALAMEALKIMEYGQTANETLWREAMDLRKSNQAELSKLEDVARTLASTAPDLPRMEAEVDQRYLRFETVSEDLPALLAESRADLTSVLSSYETFDRTLHGYLDPLAARLERDLASGADLSRLRDDYAMVKMGNGLSQEGSKFFFEALVGLNRGDLDMLDKSIADNEKIIKSATDFQTSVKEVQAKAELGKVIDSVNACHASLQALRDNIARSAQNLSGRTQSVDAALEAIDLVSDTLSKVTMDFAAETISVTDRAWRALIIGVIAAFVLSLLISLITSSRLTGQLLRITENLSRGSDEVLTASMELSQASHSVAAGTSENAAALEETSAAIEELSSMTSRNGENAGQAQSLIRSARDAVVESEQAIDKAIVAMTAIADSGNQISKIIKTIDEIAFQTNLLALNAAVEAARAGESGAGFAVVAEEVRNLAIRSADAARNTAGLIDKTITDIGLGSSLIKNTYGAFESLGGQVKEVSEIIESVAAASKEQSTGISQITVAIHEMDQVTQNNAAASEETAGAANSLSKEARSLDENARELLALINGQSKHNGQAETQRIPHGEPSLGTQGAQYASPRRDLLPMES